MMVNSEGSDDSLKMTPLDVNEQTRMAHYENMPIQIYRKIYLKKLKNFR